MLFQRDTKQVVSSPIIFKRKVVVRDHLLINGPVDGKSFQKVVTTISDQNLTSIYNLEGKTSLKGNIFVDGFVNNINVSQWAQRVVKKNSEDTQTVNNIWSVAENITFAENVYGSGLLGDLDVKVMQELVQEKKEFKDNVEQKLIVSVLFVFGKETINNLNCFRKIIRRYVRTWIIY